MSFTISPVGQTELPDYVNVTFSQINFNATGDANKTSIIHWNPGRVVMCVTCYKHLQIFILRFKKNIVKLKYRNQFKSSKSESM